MIIASSQIRRISWRGFAVLMLLLIGIKVAHCNSTALDPIVPGVLETIPQHLPEMKWEGDLAALLVIRYMPQSLSLKVAWDSWITEVELKQKGGLGGWTGPWPPFFKPQRPGQFSLTPDQLTDDQYRTFQEWCIRRARAVPSIFVHSVPFVYFSPSGQAPEGQPVVPYNLALGTPRAEQKILLMGFLQGVYLGLVDDADKFVAEIPSETLLKLPRSGVTLETRVEWTAPTRLYESLFFAGVPKSIRLVVNNRVVWEHVYPTPTAVVTEVGGATEAAPQKPVLDDPSRPLDGPGPAPPSHERRVALVIGNAEYRTIGLLANPKSDALLMAKTLTDVGFAVTVKTDLSREQLVTALSAFATAAAQADWAIIYYSGHGIEVGGVNYLIPTDAQLATDTSAQFEAITLQQAMAAVEGARRLRMVILDACRANPFASRMRVAAASRAPARGLGPPPEPDPGELIVYAARDGEFASDGSGSNSPFTEALVREIQTSRVDVRRLFDDVRDDVIQSTGGRQHPFTYGSLPGRRDFLFLQ